MSTVGYLLGISGLMKKGEMSQNPVWVSTYWVLLDSWKGETCHRTVWLSTYSLYMDSIWVSTGNIWTHVERGDYIESCVGRYLLDIIGLIRGGDMSQNPV